MLRDKSEEQNTQLYSGFWTYYSKVWYLDITENSTLTPWPFLTVLSETNKTHLGGNLPVLRGKEQQGRI